MIGFFLLLLGVAGGLDWMVAACVHVIVNPVLLFLLSSTPSTGRYSFQSVDTVAIVWLHAVNGESNPLEIFKHGRDPISTN